MAIQTRQDIIDYAKSRIGFPTVSVCDINDSQIDFILDFAINRFYEQAIGFAQKERVLYIPVEKGNHIVDISEVDPQPTSVITVIDDHSNHNMWTNINSLFTMENMMIHKWGFNLNAPDMLTFQMIYNWMDNFNTMFGLQYRAEINEKAKEVYITPSPRSDGGMFLGVYAKVPEEELYSYSWIHEYVYAKCLVQIGMNRGKYSGQALPGGGMLNAEMYLTKGEEMVARLEEQLLLEWSEPADFFVG
jgi:hypothetical protein